jgi:hypothetical protein
VCDLLHGIFKYVATQGKLVIKSNKRNPLLSSLNVYELLNAPKGGGCGATHGISLFIWNLKLL